MKPSVELFLSDSRGIYIPRDFAQCVNHKILFGVSDEDLADLENPDSETHWDTWSDVCDNAFVYAPTLAGWEYDTATLNSLAMAHAALDDKARDTLLAMIPGTKYNLYQDGDLFLVPDGMEFTDAGDNAGFSWPCENPDCPTHMDGDAEHVDGACSE